MSAAAVGSATATVLQCSGEGIGCELQILAFFLVLILLLEIVDKLDRWFL